MSAFSVRIERIRYLRSLTFICPSGLEAQASEIRAHYRMLNTYNWDADEITTQFRAECLRP